METYTIAATHEELDQGLGKEIMASGPVEARDKYEVICGEHGPGGAVVVQHPDGSRWQTWIEIEAVCNCQPDEND